MAAASAGCAPSKFSSSRTSTSVQRSRTLASHTVCTARSRAPTTAASRARRWQQFHELFARHVQLVLLLDHAVRHDVVHEQQADVVWQRVEKVRDVPLPPTAHLLHARARAHQRRALLVRAVPPCCTCVARCVHSPALIPDQLRRHVNYRSTHARPSLDPRSYRACPVRPTTPVRL